MKTLSDGICSISFPLGSSEEYSIVRWKSSCEDIPSPCVRCILGNVLAADLTNLYTDPSSKHISDYGFTFQLAATPTHRPPAVLFLSLTEAELMSKQQL
jgi:hypothetical protein